jgi:hypothetical protein
VVRITDLSLLESVNVKSAGGVHEFRQPQ